MTLKCAMGSLAVGVVWALLVSWMMAAQYVWSDYIRDGIVWFILSMPVLYCMLREFGHGHPFACSVLSAFLFALPFAYAALLVTDPMMTVPALFGTIGVMLPVGTYSFISHTDKAPLGKETN